MRYFMYLCLMLPSTFSSICNDSNDSQTSIFEECYPGFIQYKETPQKPTGSLYSRFKEACIADDADTAESIIKVDRFFRKKSEKTSLLPPIKPSSTTTQARPLLGVKKATSTISWLLSKKDEFNCDILYVVSSKGLANTTDTLLDQGANLHSKNGIKEKTPLCIGIQNGHQDVVQLILEKLKNGEVNNPCDRYGNRPLHIASKNYDMTNLLFIDNADIYTRNNAGKKPDDRPLPANIRELYEEKKAYEKNRNNS